MPRYQRHHFEENQRENKIVSVVSNEKGQNHCWIHQNAKISLGYFTRNDNLTDALNGHDKAVFAFVINGSLRIANQEITMHNVICLCDTDEIAIKHFA